MSIMPDLTTDVAGIIFKNPTILASGVLGETAQSLKRIIATGAGGVVTKSIGLEPRSGHANPTIVELDHGLLNAMGLPNPGMDEYEHELMQVLDLDVPVIGSIFGKDGDEFSKLALKMTALGVDAVELNLSCPHASGYGTELGSEPRLVEQITAGVKNSINKPVFVKLTPNTANITALGHAAVNGGADALVAINTVKGMAIAPEVGEPVLSNTFGGYSGPAIKPIGLRCVFELAKADLGRPIIGVGGITTGKDVVEYMMAGATAVQIGTAVYYHGVPVFGAIVDELNEFMKQNGYDTVKDMIGLAVKPGA